MARTTIWSNNSVEMVSETVDINECKINIIVEGSSDQHNFFWISRNQEEQFKKDFADLMGKYTI